MNELEKLKLEKAVSHAARSSMGIYCQTIVNADGSRIERTPWQDGWNAAVIDLEKKRTRIRKFLKILPDEVTNIIAELIESTQLEILCEAKEAISMYLNVNDTFYYASADAEDVLISDIPKIYELWKKYDHHGITAWVALKRNMDPLDELKTEKYDAAIKEILNEGS